MATSGAQVAGKVLIARRMTAAVIERARHDFDAIVTDRDLACDEALDIIRAERISAVLIGKKSGFQADHVAALPDHLRIIANPSAGVDHMDVAAAQRRGIIVTNAPDAVTEATADFTMLLILAACRRAAEYLAIMRSGWRRPFGLPDMLGQHLGGRRLGIIGMGRIGQAVARRAQAFGMRILYHNRRPLAAELAGNARYCETVEALLAESDVVSLNLPGGSTPLMTREMFALMRPGSVFVNAARGSLVDEDALYDALSSRHLFGAGLDVFRHEPDFDERFAALPNVFLTPHMGSATETARDRMGFDALDNIAAVLSGQPPISPV